MLLDAGGPVEAAAQSGTAADSMTMRLHCEDFVRIPLSGEPLLTQALRASDVQVVDDLGGDRHAEGGIALAGGHTSLALVPLILDTRVVGLLGTGATDGQAPSTLAETERAYLRSLGEHVAIAVDRVTFLSERRAAEEAMRKGEQRYRRFVESSVAGVWAQDRAGVITYASDPMAALVSSSPEDLVGTSVREFVFEEDRPAFERFIDDRSQGRNGTFEWRLRHDSDTPRWFLLSATPVVDDAGEYHGAFVMATEITHRKQAELEREHLLEEVREMLGGVVEALASTTAERDPYTSIHQARVARLAVAIAERMGLEPDVIEGLRIAGTLHDIGKIAVPAEILSKPGTLTDMEMGIVRTHSTIGARLLAGVRFPRPVAAMVQQHHERLDGSGYPEGLFGEEILLEARILAVADVVEAMASHRPYRPARGIELALGEISRGAGTQYDIEVVDACVTLFESEPAYVL